jgi:hypothetical protein
MDALHVLLTGVKGYQRDHKIEPLILHSKHIFDSCQTPRPVAPAVYREQPFYEDAGQKNKQEGVIYRHHLSSNPDR